MDAASCSTQKVPKVNKTKTSFWSISEGCFLQYKCLDHPMLRVFHQSDCSCVDWPFLCKENKNLVAAPIRLSISRSVLSSLNKTQMSTFHLTAAAENFTTGVRFMFINELIIIFISTHFDCLVKSLHWISQSLNDLISLVSQGWGVLLSICIIKIHRWVKT